MSFIERELKKIGEVLQGTPNDDPRSEYLRTAQQALSWALEPDGFASPTSYLHKFHSVGSDGTKGTGLGKWDMSSEAIPAKSIPAN